MSKSRSPAAQRLNDVCEEVLAAFEDDQAPDCSAREAIMVAHILLTRHGDVVSPGYIRAALRRATLAMLARQIRASTLRDMPRSKPS